MWIYLNDAFLSIVAHRDEPAMLLVRARVNGDIERVFRWANVLATPTADYPYRATISREDVADALAQRALEISYTNLKASVPDPVRHDAYFGAYNATVRLEGHPRLVPVAAERPRRRVRRRRKA